MNKKKSSLARLLSRKWNLQGEVGSELKEGGHTTPLMEMFSWVITGVTYLIILAFFPLSLCFCIKVIKEYERVVIFRLGRLMSGAAKGPGLIFVLPCLDSHRKIDLRVVSYAVPPQEILSKDSVTVSVDAVVYFRTVNPIASVKNVDDAIYSTKLLTQTTLRNALGMKTLSEMLMEREAIAQLTETILDEATENWGIKVERVEVKDIRLPPSLTRAMAAEAEAAREARARIVAAEGEQKASRGLREAAEVISGSPTALQLRYLQTLSSIAAEHNSTIVFPVPVDIFKPFMEKGEKERSRRRISRAASIDVEYHDEEDETEQEKDEKIE